MRLTAIALAVWGLQVVFTLPVHAATLVADYQFQNNLTSVVQPAPDLEIVGAGNSTFTTEWVDGQGRTVATFDEGTGFRVETDGLVAANDYSVVMLVRFDVLSLGDVTTEFRKVLDFKDRSSDSGLYNLNGFLAFYDASNPLSFIGAVGGVIEIPDTYVQIALTRDAGGVVAAYVEGVQVLSFSDAGGLAVLDDDDSLDEFLNFFIDDDIDPTPLNTSQFEGASGAVSRIRLYDGDLTAMEVAQLDRVPEPCAACLAVVGMTAFGVLRRRSAPRRGDTAI